MDKRLGLAIRRFLSAILWACGSCSRLRSRPPGNPPQQSASTKPLRRGPAEPPRRRPAQRRLRRSAARPGTAACIGHARRALSLSSWGGTLPSEAEDRQFLLQSPRSRERHRACEYGKARVAPVRTTSPRRISRFPDEGPGQPSSRPRTRFFFARRLTVVAVRKRLSQRSGPLPTELHHERAEQERQPQSTASSAPLRPAGSEKKGGAS